MSDDRPVPPFENDPFASRVEGPPVDPDSEPPTDAAEQETMRPVDWMVLIAIALVSIISALILVAGCVWVIKQVSFTQCVSNAQSIGADPVEVCLP